LLLVVVVVAAAVVLALGHGGVGGHLATVVTVHQFICAPM